MSSIAPGWLQRPNVHSEIPDLNKRATHDAEDNYYRGKRHGLRRIAINRLREMELFVRVVETGSFSAAARDFNIGQPAIPKMVAGLENRLSARLLVRSTRRLSLTKQGWPTMNVPSAR